MAAAGRRGHSTVLRVTEGTATGRVLAADPELLIGRAALGDGRLGDDPAISRRHARVIRTADGKLLIVDQGSTNGTWVNGERITSRALAVGDRIEVGTTTLELTEGAAPVAERPTAVVERPALGPADPSRFRAEFPVFERFRYLNAGTDGPVPRRAGDAAAAQIELELELGRASDDYWASLAALWEALRSGYAGILGCDAAEVALTRAATDGINTVLAGLDLRRGDEIVTSDEEHVGLYAPLAAQRDRRGVRIRVAPFDRIAEAVGDGTRLVACSHVSWMTGRVVDAAALAATGVPILLDGAQGLGAVPVDVRALGCAFYAAPGQKWLCGPDRSGCLYVRSDHNEEISPPAWPNWFSLADTTRPLDLVLVEGARRFDPGTLPGVLARWALASLDVLCEAGIGWVTERGPALAAELSVRLEERGVRVAPRGESTLVSFEMADPQGTVERWAHEGVLVRDIPGRGYVRASIGAWCLTEDLDRLVDLAT